MNDEIHFLPLGLNDTKRDWMDQAYCRNNKIPTEVFFPVRGAAQGHENPKQIICKHCSVTKECLDYALNNYLSVGIYGGTSGRDRRRLQRERHEQS
jgi:WhiB family redox-sensing transcriptional regulator